MITYTEAEVTEARNEAEAELRAEPGFVDNHGPGTFSYHEAFHTASLIMEQLDSALLGHPAIVLDPEAYRLTHEGFTAIFNLYQYLGSRHLADEVNQT